MNENNKIPWFRSLVLDSTLSCLPQIHRQEKQTRHKKPLEDNYTTTFTLNSIQLRTQAYYSVETSWKLSSFLFSGVTRETPSKLWGRRWRIFFRCLKEEDTVRDTTQTFFISHSKLALGVRERKRFEKKIQNINIIIPLPRCDCVRSSSMSAE